MLPLSFFSPYVHQSSYQPEQEDGPLLFSWAEPYLIPVPSYTIGDTMQVTCYVNASSSSSLSGPQFPHPYKWIGAIDFSQLFQP